MGERTNIEWAHHTFNPWIGCTQVSSECDRCYAKNWGDRFGVEWGAGKPRHVTSERTWAQPYRWNEKAKRDGVRRRVFCASMADVFDNEAPEGARERLWKVIEDNTALDWLLLTKRIGNALSMVPESWQKGFPSHVWPGATVGTQKRADEDILKLLRLHATVHFLSCEPLLEALTIPRFTRLNFDVRGDFPIGHTALARAGVHHVRRNKNGARSVLAENGEWLGIKPGECTDVDVDWIITGAESGRNARPMDESWIRSLRDQCESAGVSFFYKQDVRNGIKISTPLLDGRRWVDVPEAAA